MILIIVFMLFANITQPNPGINPNLNMNPNPQMFPNAQHPILSSDQVMN